MFVYQNTNGHICVTFEDNKPVKTPDYVFTVDAHTLCVNGEEIAPVKVTKIEENCVNTACTVITETVGIDLNGCTVSIPEDTTGDGVYMVPQGGKLIISGDGVINGVGKNDYNMAIWANGGDVIINDGTITNKGAAGNDNTHFDLVYAKNGSVVTINGGTFICETPQWTLNNNDSNPGKFVVKGGRFFQYDPSNSMTEPTGAVNNFVAEGYKVINDGDWYEVVKA